MNTQRIVTATFVMVLIGSGCVFAWRYFAPADRIAEVQQLQSELVSQSFDDSVSKWKLDRTTESLMRQVDQLNEEQRKTAWKAVGEQYRQWHLEGARAWHALPESDRRTYLESRLSESRKWRRVFYAMRADVPRVPNRFRKSYLANQEATSTSGKQSESEASERREGRKAENNDGQRSSRREGDGRRRRRSRDQEQPIDPNDPDAVLLAEYRKAIGELRRTQWRERQQQSSDAASRGPGA